ncbi:hypothetical protein AbraIFM66950_009616 [Aspergillus brasiliensis]|nr:hypothetical protein AbraIFM66950_009616 [Aspergillus brasiliensis]
MNLQTHSVSVTTAPNTDGWDVYRSDSIVIQDSVINNTDDCVSFKPNSTNVLVQGLQCNGSHGISVGSLGQYADEVDIVENIYVYNVSMSNASDGARIKVWPGIQSGTDALNGGGGSGYVKNVTYDTFENYNNAWAIELNQCYEQSNATLCALYPVSFILAPPPPPLNISSQPNASKSLLKISDVVFKNVYGITSTKYDPEVGTLVCSDPQQCQNITATNVTVTPPSGKTPVWICENFDYSGLEGFECISS